MKLLLYCTKAKPYLYDFRNVLGMFDIYGVKQAHFDNLLLNGKIVAECDFEIEEITIGRSYGFAPNLCIISTKNLQPIELLSKSCYESYDDLFKYLKYDFDNDYGTHKEPYGYAIHIKNLHIFDEPRELNDCMSGKFEEWDYRDLDEVKKAPQNMQYVSSFYSDEISMWGDTYILISIQPQWLCKILNGEKTIEVRKKVLKEMLK